MSTGPFAAGRERPIRGRDTELRRLEALLAGGADGLGAVVVITAPPGLGKSTLVGRLAHQAATSGTTVLTGRATELAMGRPLGPFLDALGEGGPGPWSPERQPLELSELDRDALGDTRYVAASRVLDKLDRIASEGSALMILEDMQWADDASLWLLERLAGQVDGLRLALFVTRRPAPRSPSLDRVEERRGVVTMRLQPLPPEQLRVIVTDVLGRAPNGATTAALETADGSPLMAILLAELAIRAEGMGPSSATLDVLVRRLGSLRPETTELVSAASILGSRFQLDDLATLVGASTFSTVAHIDEAANLGLLQVDADEVSFRHDLVWRAIYDEIPESVRLGLHRDFARRVAERDGTQERALPHLVIGSRAGDRGDIDQLLRAAEQVAARDPNTAAGLYERALDLSDEADPERTEITVGLVKALLWSGQFYRARTRAERLLESRLDPVMEGELRRARARILVYQGRVEDSLAETERALERPLPAAQRARLLADASLRRLVCADPAGAAAAADEAADLAEVAGDTLAATLVRCARSRVDASEGFTSSAVARIAQALEPQSTVPRESIELLQPQLYLGLALIDADRIDQARGVFIEGRRLAEELGSAWMVPLFHLGSTIEAYIGGDWDRALVEAETGLAAADELNVSVWSPWTRALISLIELARSPDEAAPNLQRIDEHLEASGASQFGGPWLTLARMRRLELGARPDQAAALGLEDWHRVGPEWVGDRRLYGVELIRLLDQADDRDAARALLPTLQKAAERSGAAADAGALSHATGLVTRDPSPVMAAIEQYQASSRPASAARAMEDAARLSDGDVATARALARSSLAIYERLGASGEAARLVSLLRSLGVRRGVRSSRKRARTGWLSITDTERQVLRYVSEGLTNRQIAARMYLSPRTVETHISHLFGKLQVASRAELAARYADHRARNPEDP